MPQTLPPPGTPVNQRFPASSSEITFGLSIQYLIKDIVKKQQSFPRCFWHNLGICSCVNLDEISALDQADFRGLYYSGGHRDFDKFGTMEHSFVVKHELLTSSEAASCVVMQHIYTKRRRNLYVFRTVTKQKSLFSHPEWGIVSNEAYVLLGILKTNLQAHPNIIQLFNCVTTKARAGLFLHILQMEYCDGGDLWKLNSRCLKHGARIPKSLVIHVFKSLVTALAYLHHGLILLPNGTTQRHFLPASPKRWQTILHNDIKPENILFRWPVLQRTTPAVLNNSRSNDIKIHTHSHTPNRSFRNTHPPNHQLQKKEPPFTHQQPTIDSIDPSSTPSISSSSK